MTPSSSLVPARPPRTAPRLTWDFPLGGQPRGLVLAREKGCTFIWDETDWLYLLNGSGARQAQVRAGAGPCDRRRGQRVGLCGGRSGRGGLVARPRPHAAPGSAA